MGEGMGEDLSTKNLVGRCARDPWRAISGNLPLHYQIAAVGDELIRQVDLALFERKLDDAVTAGVILKKWSERDPHFYCKAPAVMASIYSVCGALAEAEKLITKAAGRISSECNDCKAHYLKRLGTVHLHQWDYPRACAAYNESFKIYLSMGQSKDAATSLLNRGVTKYLMEDCTAALHDEQEALDLLSGRVDMYTIMATINIASVLVRLNEIEEAVSKIGVVQKLLQGKYDLERPKLILRWIRAQLYEAQGDLKGASEMMDRIEPRMRKLDMKPELKVLLADRARVARRPGNIQAVARKALELEDVQRIRELIETVMTEPSQENVLLWREGLQSYVPPFPSTA